MKFARHWAKATDGELTAWGSSDDSVEAAHSSARERLARILARVKGGGFAALHSYAYGGRVLREPVLEEFSGAAVTRNSYGSEVLNTARAMFVDVDLPGAASPGVVGRLFGRKAADPEAAALEKVEGWLRRNADWGFRVYRTKAGLRLLATQGMVDPAEGEVVMTALGADPLYLRLCRSQRSYRARLTPKPWRCDIRTPGGDLQWPFANAEAERRFGEWQRAYREKANGYATCRFVRALGNPQVDPALAPALALHDERTRAATDLPLA